MHDSYSESYSLWDALLFVGTNDNRNKCVNFFRLIMNVFV